LWRGDCEPDAYCSGMKVLDSGCHGDLGANRQCAIELDFETATGEPPPGGAAVPDLNTGIEYRNDGV